MNVGKYENQVPQPVDRPKMHVFLSMCFQEFASCLGKSAHCKHAFFKMGIPHFYIVFHHLRDARKENEPGRPFLEDLGR